METQNAPGACAPGGLVPGAGRRLRRPLFPVPYSLLFPAVQPSNRRNARHTLWPPKPNELLSARRTGRSIIPSVP
jgi:hypothetical protein